MTAQTLPRRHNYTALFWLALLALVAAMLVPTIGDLSAMPRTRHAENSHVGEWNAVNIQAKITNRACSPIWIYTCPRIDVIKYVCPVMPGSDVWIGLIIGLRDNVIITGFAAPAGYWYRSSIRDGCVQAIAP